LTFDPNDRNRGYPAIIEKQWSHQSSWNVKKVHKIPPLSFSSFWIPKPWHNAIKLIGSFIKPDNAG
jgi:hypothetical protein